MQSMYYVGLDVHKKMISHCVKDVSGSIQAEGFIPAARIDLNRWMKTLPNGPRALAVAQPLAVG
jgi:transposase